MEQFKQDQELVVDEHQQPPPPPPPSLPSPLAEAVENEEQTSPSPSLPAPLPPPPSLPVAAEEENEGKGNGQKEPPSGERVRGWCFWHTTIRQRLSRRDGDRGGSSRARSTRGVGGATRVVGWGNEHGRRRRRCPLRERLREKWKITISLERNFGASQAQM